MINAPVIQQAGPWLDALEATSTRLHGLVDGLTTDQLNRPSFASGWTIAQVLSHLGSGAEICTALVAQGITASTTSATSGGEGAPGLERSELLAIWARWDGMDPVAQRSAWGQSDRAHLTLLRSISATSAETLTVPYFSGPLSLPEYAGFRLSEQSVHAWDIAVALDEHAVLPPAESALLMSRINRIASRFRDAATLDRLRTRELTVRLTETAQILSLHLGTECQLLPAHPDQPVGTITATTDELLRLIYGRNRETDRIEVTGAVTLADLTQLFPGF